MSLLGIRVPRHRSQALARVGAIVDEPRFHGHLSGRQNLQLLAAARGGAASERIGPSLERVRLAERADDKVKGYSMGMRQRLGVAACLIGDPELLILDEPMNGLDPAGMHEMRDMIDSLVAEGRTVMLSSHLLDEVQRTCQAVAIVDRGRVIRQGPIQELMRSANVGRARRVRRSRRAAASLLSPSDLVEKTDTQPGVLSVTLPRGVDPRNRRRAEPPARRGRCRRVRAARGPDEPRGLVPLGHQPAGRARAMSATVTARAPATATGLHGRPPRLVGADVAP